MGDRGFKAWKISKTQFDIYCNNHQDSTSAFEDMFWKWISGAPAQSLKRISCLGGEPLIMPKFYEFLDRVLPLFERNSDTVLMTITNMNATSNYLNKFIKYLPNILDKFILDISISIEAIGAQAEFIRNGLNWERFESNICRLLEFAKGNQRIRIGIIPSINSLCIPGYCDFLKWVDYMSKKYEITIDIKPNLVGDHDYLNPSKLPPEYSVYLDNAIDFLRQINGSTFYINYLSSIRDSIKTGANTMTASDFYKNISAFSKLRNMDFETTFPELADFYTSGKL